MCKSTRCVPTPWRFWPLAQKNRHKRTPGVVFSPFVLLVPVCFRRRCKELARLVAHGSVVQNVQVAGQHGYHKCDLVTERHLQQTVHLWNNRASGNTHNQNGRTNLCEPPP